MTFIPMGTTSGRAASSWARTRRKRDVVVTMMRWVITRRGIGAGEESG
jgi:hypothetical protein